MSILDEARALPSQPKDLRKFALTVGIAFSLLGGLLFWRGKSTAVYFLALGIALLVSGFLWPRLLKPVFLAWMTLALAMGWVMTRVILSILFYGVVTPIALVMRLKKRDILNLRFKSGESTYWADRVARSQENYEKQY